MSTVTLSNPHCAITSAENPDGIASQAFTTALPEAHTFLTLFAIWRVFLFLPLVFARHFLGAGAVSSPPAGCSPRSRRLRARYSLSPPRYHQARAPRFWCDRHAFSARNRRGSARHRRRRPAWWP